MHDDEQTNATDEHPNGPSAAPDSDLFEQEGDIDNDRQDAPRADKTGDGDEELDGLKATPGDTDEDQ